MATVVKCRRWWTMMRVSESATVPTLHILLELHTHPLLSKNKVTWYCTWETCPVADWVHSRTATLVIFSLRSPAVRPSASCSGCRSARERAKGSIMLVCIDIAVCGKPRPAGIKEARLDLRGQQDHVSLSLHDPGFLVAFSLVGANILTYRLLKDDYLLRWL